MTVVERGEGLAEGLSADRLEIAIERSRWAAPMRRPDDLAGDMPRTARITSAGSAGKASSCPSWASLIVYSSALYHSVFTLRLVSRSQPLTGGMP